MTKVKKLFPKQQKPRLNLTFFTCMHNRPEVAEIMLAGYDRLRKHFAEDANFKLVVATSGTDCNHLLESFEGDIYWKQVENRPVGNKWNQALNMAMDQGTAHYYIKMDDDDVVSNSGFDQMLHYMNQGLPYIGFDHVVFCDSQTLESSYFQYPYGGKVLGAIRAFSWECLHRSAVKIKCEILAHVSQDGWHLLPGEERWIPFLQAQWLFEQNIARPVGNDQGQIYTRIRLWTMEWNQNLDWDSDAFLAKHQIYAFAIPMDTPAVVDIKVEGKNIWDYSTRGPEGQPYNVRHCMNSWSDTEVRLLESLSKSKLEIINA